MYQIILNVIKQFSAQIFHRIYKYIVVFICVVMGLTFIPKLQTAVHASATTGSLPIGSYVKFGAYFGDPILWRVINNDENGTMLLSDKIICLKSFDAFEDTEFHSIPESADLFVLREAERRNRYGFRLRWVGCKFRR